MIEFIDKTSEQAGTPINRKNFMALQGFEAQTTTFNEDGSITETNAMGHTKTTTFGVDAEGNSTVKETFVGEKTITKTTTFNQDGSVSEVIS